ncbi:MAG: PDZ domain-containing protein [Lentimicrobium sp.]|uniref:PDZ domain-containing protein n=1 Tax=Lentimicrobium sp. TaxID=2034841 RepID=UPI0025E5942B|nr:PDZ domain-containing protein [Lentimicrobium sp.]MCO5257579.1 PDZ domain-containing protein [Lentimicrobium sp.]
MKFKYIALILGTMVSGCKMFTFLNEARKETLTYNIEHCKVNIKDNYIFVETQFEDYQTRNFILDLGSPINVVFDDSIFKNHTLSEESLMLKNTKSADGNKMKREYLNWGKISTCLFSVDNSFISHITRDDKYLCNKIDGIWGAEIFAPNFKGKKNKILLINMRDSMLTILDSLPEISKWVELDVKFTPLSQIKVKVKINGIPEYLFFDTGFSGDIMLTSVIYKKVNDKYTNSFDERKIYGQISSSLSGTIQDTAYSKHCLLELTQNLKQDSISLFTTQSVVVSALGMGVIKRFNVLVDYQHRKLYLQPNLSYKPSPPSFFHSKGFRAKLTNENKIKIVNITSNSKSESAGLQIGDEIISINEISSQQEDKCRVVEIFDSIDAHKNNNQITIKRQGKIMKIII